MNQHLRHGWPVSHSSKCQKITNRQICEMLILSLTICALLTPFSVVSANNFSEEVKAQENHAEAAKIFRMSQLICRATPEALAADFGAPFESVETLFRLVIHLCSYDFQSFAHSLYLLSACLNLELQDNVLNIFSSNGLFRRSIFLQKRRMGRFNADFLWIASFLSNSTSICAIAPQSDLSCFLHQSLCLHSKPSSFGANAPNRIISIAQGLLHSNIENGSHRLCSSVLHVHPDTPAALDCLAAVAFMRGDYDLAASLYSRVVALQERPDVFSVLNVANALANGGRIAAADVFFQKAYELDASFDEAIVNRVISRLDVCDWREYDGMVAAVIAAVEVAAAQRRVPSVRAFDALYLPLPLEVESAVVSLHSSSLFNVAQLLHFHPPPPHFVGVLRIALLSMDFREHNTGLQLRKLIATTSKRKTLRLLLFSRTMVSPSPIREELRGACDEFIDVGTFSERRIAQEINNRGCHVLADLHGFTKGRMTVAVALRPCPAQLNMVAFVASMRASFIDWSYLDRVVAPPELQHRFTEKLLLVPPPYFINSHVLEPHVEPRDPSVRNFLPEAVSQLRRPIVAAFNTPYKFSPPSMEVYCKILKLSNGSLWLQLPSKGPLEFESNIRSWMRAKCPSLPPSCLAFTDQFPPHLHIAIKSYADLFVDVLPSTYGAHSTALDAIWARLPVLSLPGEKAVSRVAATLALAASAPFVARTVDELIEASVAIAKARIRPTTAMGVADVGLMAESFRRAMATVHELSSLDRKHMHVAISRRVC